MKKMKKLASLFLAALMMLTMALPVMATENESSTTHDIVIKNSIAGHTYEAYQIFSGDLYIEGAKKTLSNIRWGSGFDSARADSFITELAAAKVFEENGINPFANSKIKTAYDVSKIIQDYDNDSEKMDKFSEIVSKYTTNTKEISSENKEEDGSVYTIKVSQDGYYFVKDAESSGKGTDDAQTKYILQVVGDVNITAKADVPSIDKNTNEGEPICEQDNHNHTIDCFGEKVKFNNAAIGDIVYFEAPSNVPAMDGYEKYFFIVQDTMQAGFTLNDDIVVKVGNTLLTKGNGPTPVVGDDPLPINSYYVEYKDAYGKIVSSPSQARSFKIVFENFIQYKEKAGTAISITYSAVVNKDVTVGPAGEVNKVKLIYSNNPNVQDEGIPGKPDEPTPDFPTGETVDHETRTFVFAIQLNKVNEAGEPLAGAQFTITSTAFNKILVSETKFVEDVKGEYYLLKSGNYTKTAPVQNDKEPEKDTTKYYESIETKYRKETVTSTKYVVVADDETVTGDKWYLKNGEYIKDAPEGENTSDYATGEDGKILIFKEVDADSEVAISEKFTSYVGEDGVLKLTGLKEGEYIIHEDKAPNGYNILAGDIKVTITWNEPKKDSTTCTWTVKKDNEEEEIINAPVYTFNVENNSGSLLPSTGGIGTTIFYIVGGILIVGAGILLVAKKRMSAK